MICILFLVTRYTEAILRYCAYLSITNNFWFVKGGIKNMAGNFDRKESDKKYYQKNKESRKSWIADWRRRNPEKVREYNHRYYMKHKERKENENRSD